MSNDKLIVQVALNILLPPGKSVSKRVLQQILDLMIDHKPLPKNVTVRGIFWRNPARAGKLGAWRYHEGADLSTAPHPLEDSPRGSLRDAIDTLSPFISTNGVTF